MTITIPASYVEIDHHILKEVCPICNEQFKVGDSIELVPLQVSKTELVFNSEAIPVHTECHFVQ